MSLPKSFLVWLNGIFLILNDNRDIYLKSLRPFFVDSKGVSWICKTYPHLNVCCLNDLMSTSALDSINHEAL